MQKDLSDEEQARVDAQIAANPDLEPRNKTRTGRGQAARNARKILKAAFPGIPFRVWVQSPISLGVSWPALEGAPHWRHVNDLLARFRDGRYDGQAEDYYYDSDKENEAFRLAFGRVQYIHANSHQPSASETAAWLGTQMPASAARKGTRKARL